MIKDLVAKSLNWLKNNKIFSIIGIILAAFMIILLSLYMDLTEAQDFILQNRRQATLISLVVYIMLGFTFIPATPLTLFLALILGPLHAAVIATTGNTLAALVEYKIGATLGDVFSFESKKNQMPFGLSKLPMTSPYLLMAGRLLPVGKRGFSIVCGAYQVPIGRYLWTSIFMYILDATIVAFVGVGIIRLF